MEEQSWENGRRAKEGGARVKLQSPRSGPMMHQRHPEVGYSNPQATLRPIQLVIRTDSHSALAKGYGGSGAEQSGH